MQRQTWMYEKLVNGKNNKHLHVTKETFAEEFFLG
jgi:hypothetical protein